MSTITKLAKLNGWKMRDAERPAIIDLTGDDILKGTKKNPASCAFACAVVRQLPGAREAYFFRSTAWVLTAKTIWRYMLPAALKQEILAFDRGGKPAPGRFVLRAPKGTQRQGEAARRRKGKSAPTTNPVRRYLTDFGGKRAAVVPYQA